MTPSGSEKDGCPTEEGGAGPARLGLRVPRGARLSHDQLKGVRIGEASNPGPAITLPPWQPDPDHTTNFAILGKDGLFSSSLDPL